MSEGATRRGTREKKPPKTYWFDVSLGVARKPTTAIWAPPATRNRRYIPPYPGTTQQCPGPQPSCQASLQVPTLSQSAQLAPHLGAKELQDTQATELLSAQPDGLKEADNASQLGSKRGEGRMTREGASDVRSSRPRDGSQGVNGQGKGGARDGKARAPRGSKSTQQLTNLETDLSYHNALNEHVKNVYPNINALSPDMLKELSIPTEFLGKQQVPKARGKEEKRVGGVRGKEENKPFKRQSYHVAIAYHIHLKQVKNNKSVEYVDPTYPARKLREQSQPQSKKP